MTQEYGIYEQGALFFREDFDPVKQLIISAKCMKLS